MATIQVLWPACLGNHVIKFGVNSAGSQRYRCKDASCSKDTFLLTYRRKGDLPETKKKIFSMALNGSGVRDTSRVLGISINIVISELKKKRR